MRNLLFALATVLLAPSVFGDEARLLRFPDVHTNQIAFAYAGDIYIAPRAGGTAVKLTHHEGIELFPKFSPDGRQVAFTGQYDGDMAVYVMPVTGGEPTRLTYHPSIQRTSERFGPENIVMGWHPDGDRVLFRSRRESNDWWDGRAYLVDIAGGMPVPLPMKTAGFTSLSPDAKQVAYCPISRDFRTWKRYKGGMAQDVWIFNLETFENEKITDWEGTDNMPMWYEERIYFASDRTGTLNLYCYDRGTGQTRPVTEFTEFDVRWPSLGSEGIAFENGGYVYVLDLPSETLHKVEIQLSTDRRLMRPEFVRVSDSNGVRDFDLSPDGKRAAFSARGEIFTVPAKKGNTRNLTNTSGANERNPQWSPDGRHLAFISDETGEEELYLISHDGEEKRQLTDDGYCHKYGPAWSPNSQRLAFSDKELKLYYIEVESGRKFQIDETTRNEVRSFAWSPDSRYLAYTKRLDNRITAVFMYSFEDQQIHQVTPGYTNDFNPVFDPDGKYLYFLSQREFNPILSNYEFEFVNNAITNLFLIVLSAEEKSPFAPESDEVEFADDKEETKEETDEKAKDKDEKDKSPEPVRIDFEGIFERQVAFALPAGNYGGLAAIPGNVFYSSYPIFGLRGRLTRDQTVLHKYDMEKQKDHKFASGVNAYALAFNHKRMLLQKDGAYHIVGTSGKKADFEDNRLDLTQMEMRLDRRAEFEQMFEETWRMQRDFFYDRQMHGVDWEAMHDLYRQLLPHCAHRSDLTYILGEMIGELCCSHTYVGGGDRVRLPGSEIGLLGVDFEIDPTSQRLRIARILRGENWDTHLRSPLLEPGVDAKEGDFLLAIDGEEVATTVNPYALMQNKVGKLVELTLNDRPTMNDARRVVVKPIASEEALRYFNWVEDRRQYVDSISGGQIGYLHLPDMDSYGLFRFSKMFYHQLRKPGLIIDVRYNGGGFVSGLILERLRRVVAAMGASRTFAEGPAPGSGINAHMITLINEFSCSDGDYFPYFFREYNLGPLMGKRTWGGVIGIRGYRPLVDGGYYTAPEFSIYSLEGEWIMENVGVIPDMEVDNLPHRLAQGYDDQLDAAIDYVTGKLESEPRTLPPMPGPPQPR